MPTRARGAGAGEALNDLVLTPGSGGAELPEGAKTLQARSSALLPLFLRDSLVENAPHIQLLAADTDGAPCQPGGQPLPVWGRSDLLCSEFSSCHTEQRRWPPAPLSEQASVKAHVGGSAMLLKLQPSAHSLLVHAGLPPGMGS